MRRQDWKYFKYEIAEFLFRNQLDEAFREGQASGIEYTSRKLSFAVRNLEVAGFTKTQRIGHDASIEAIAIAKKEITERTGVRL